MVDDARDPVCGMEIRPREAVATEEHEGRTFHFCSHACHATFLTDPHRYGHPVPRPDAGHGDHAGHSGHH